MGSKFRIWPIRISFRCNTPPDHTQALHAQLQTPSTGRETHPAVVGLWGNLARGLFFSSVLRLQVLRFVILWILSRIPDLTSSPAITCSGDIRSSNKKMSVDKEETHQVSGDFPPELLGWSSAGTGSTQRRHPVHVTGSSGWRRRSITRWVGSARSSGRTTGWSSAGRW